MPSLTALTTSDSWKLRRRRLAIIDATVAATGLVALAAWDFTGLDINVVRALGGPAGFPLRDHWLTAGLLHGGVRFLAWGLLAAFVVSLWQPWGPMRSISMHQRLWFLATALACAVLIPLIKRFSATSCPWSLAEFGGGIAQYVPHWAYGLTDGGPGGCFPSGHASTAFIFFAGWFVLREAAPSSAKYWLLATLVAGFLLGAVQVARGAHYPSHPIWTAWICWVVSAISFHIFHPRAALPTGAIR